MINKQTTVFLIIDVQNDFCPGGALAVDDGDDIVEPINRLGSTFDIKVLTQDWHPQDHTSFHDNHSNKDPFSIWQAPYGDQVLWPRHCVQGSPGAEFHSDLNTENADLVLRKGFRAAIDSYSAFFENDKKTQTGLNGYLCERGVKEIYIGGLATDFCVYYSAIDATKLGFDVSLVTDCCRAIDLDNSLSNATADMITNGIAMVSSEQILQS